LAVKILFLFSYQEQLHHIVEAIKIIFYFPKICQSPRFNKTFSNVLASCGEENLVFSPSPSLQDHSFSSIHTCCHNTFAATVLIWRITPSSAA